MRTRLERKEGAFYEAYCRIAGTPPPDFFYFKALAVDTKLVGVIKDHNQNAASFFLKAHHDTYMPASKKAQEPTGPKTLKKTASRKKRATAVFSQIMAADDTVH